MRPFFKDDDFQFATENVLGGVFHRAADVGEVLATIDHIPNGKAAAWVEQWTATADRLAAQADADADAGRRRSAAAQYLRAANYYSEASDKADATPDPALVHRAVGVAPRRLGPVRRPERRVGTSTSSASRSPTRTPRCPATSSAPAPPTSPGAR